MGFSPRFPGVAEAWARSLRESYEGWLVRHVEGIATAPPERTIYAWSAVANDHEQLAYVLYAAGEQLDLVREHLLGSARAHLQLVERRGTGTADPPPREYATGHSRSTYLRACMALLGGDVDLARALAALVWDPPDASYVGKNSVLCTSGQQRLAYGLGAFLRNEAAEAAARLSTRVTGNAYGEYLMLQGLVTSRTDLVRQGLPLVLSEHERAASRPSNAHALERYLCVPALGLAAAAIARGVVQRDDVPASDPYCPRDLIRLEHGMWQLP